jgi:hypothetical protein
MHEITFSVSGCPPAKNEAKSMLAAGHVYADRVVEVLRAARDAAGPTLRPLFGTDMLGLELVVTAPSAPPSDATNYLGGVGDVLEAKARRSMLEHLGELAGVALYENDRQIQEVHYRYQAGQPARYIRPPLVARMRQERVAIAAPAPRSTDRARRASAGVVAGA